MMRKLRLESERRSEEAALVAAQPEAAPLLTRLEEIYGALRASAPLANGLEQMRGIYHGSTLLALGHALHEASIEAAKPEAERETDYRARNVPFLVKRLTKRLADLHPPHEAALLRRAARSAGGMTLVAEGLAALEVAATALEADPAWRPAAARLSASELACCEKAKLYDGFPTFKTVFTKIAIQCCLETFHDHCNQRPWLKRVLPKPLLAPVQALKPSATSLNAWLHPPPRF